jgi:hypothetical protein
MVSRVEWYHRSSFSLEKRSTALDPGLSRVNESLQHANADDTTFTLKGLTSGSRFGGYLE